jgi:hypothetical protein
MVPTAGGLRVGSDCYIQQIKGFPDLPHVASGLTRHRRLLLALGVRTRPSLEVLLRSFKAADKAKWDPLPFLRLLEEHKSDFSNDEVKALTKLPFLRCTSRPGLHAPPQLIRPCEKLEGLNLPLLQWHAPRRFDYSLIPRQPEAYLLQLGLRAAPSAAELLQAIAECAKPAAVGNKEPHDGSHPPLCPLTQRGLDALVGYLRDSTVNKEEYGKAAEATAFLPCTGPKGVCPPTPFRSERSTPSGCIDPCGRS